MNCTFRYKLSVGGSEQIALNPSIERIDSVVDETIIHK
jgi:hypothetical protein